MTLVPIPPVAVDECGAAWEHSLRLAVAGLVDGNDLAVGQLLTEVANIDAGRTVIRCLLSIADHLLAAVPREYRNDALSIALIRTVPDRIEEFE